MYAVPILFASKRKGVRITREILDKIAVVQDRKSLSMYIRMRELPYDHGENRGDTDRVDYAANGKVIGVLLLNIRRGMHLDSLPYRRIIEHVLHNRGIAGASTRGKPR